MTDLQQNESGTEGNVGNAARSLRESETRFQTLAEAIPGLVWSCTPEGSCDYINGHWEEYTGADAKQVFGYEGLKFIHPEDVAGLKENWKQAVATASPFRGELRLLRRDGVYRWHQFRGKPQINEAHQISHWVGIAIDIEEEKQAKEKVILAHEEVTYSKENLEKMITERTRQLNEVIEELEAFSYSLSHDMRAPLRAMHSYAELVVRDFGDQVPEDAVVYLQKIMSSAQRLDTLVREVLVYTKVSQGRITIEPIDLERVISEIQMVYPALNSPEVEIEVKKPLASVLADETSMTQALSNLMNNAIKFVPAGRKPRVEIWTELMGEKVRINVRDNGVGIAEADQGRIFKMFERISNELRSEGSGIGLTIVRKAIERMDGKVGVESVVGQGSKFWIELKKGELC